MIPSPNTNSCCIYSALLLTNACLLCLLHTNLVRFSVPLNLVERTHNTTTYEIPALQQFLTALSCGLACASVSSVLYGNSCMLPGMNSRKLVVLYSTYTYIYPSAPLTDCTIRYTFQ